MKSVFLCALFILKDMRIDGKNSQKPATGSDSAENSEFNPPPMWTDADNMIYLRYHNKRGYEMTSANSRLERLRQTKFGKTYIGDRAFYMTVLSLIIPVIIQNSISNFVSLLDNLMVGSVSVEQMNGVSMANQLIFVFNLCVFGAVSGPCIFGAQFFGAHDREGVRNCFRYAMLIALGVSCLGAAVFLLFREPLISAYINNPDSAESAAEMLRVGTEYILIMILGLLPFAVSQAYAGTLRVTGETKLPMIAAVTGVIVNLALNAILIFGLFGFPELKARGAAIATVISRYVELSIIVFFAHARERKNPDNRSYSFLNGAYKSAKIPAKLVKSITVKGFPLLLNECMWSMGMAKLVQLYSRLGPDVVAANTVTSTLTNLFNVFFISMGTAASVMVGQALGRDDAKLAKQHVKQLALFQMMICVSVGLVLFLAAPLLPACFSKTDAEIRKIAANMIRVCALAMPINGFSHLSYFILRSGGRTVITFLFDSAYTWLVPIPLVLALVTFSPLTIVPIYALCHLMDFLKAALGYVLLKKGIWIRNIVS